MWAPFSETGRTPRPRSDSAVVPATSAAVSACIAVTCGEKAAHVRYDGVGQSASSGLIFSDCVSCSKGDLMKGVVRSVAAIVASIALAGAALAADTSKIVNVPGNGWSVFGSQVTSKMIKDDTVQGGVAERVTVSGKGANPWDSGAGAAIVQPIQKGDVLLLAFWARAEEPMKGSDGVNFNVTIQEGAAPYTALAASTPIHATKTWKMFYITGTAASDYPANAVNANLHLALGAQVIDFGPVAVLDFGPGYDVSKLPHN
jgi:hypothetical protein